MLSRNSVHLRGQKANERSTFCFSQGRSEYSIPTFTEDERDETGKRRIPVQRLKQKVLVRNVVSKSTSESKRR